jgi:hypothetical protein
MQASLLDNTFEMKLIAFPFLTDRSEWDPHLSPLHSEIKQDALRIHARNNLEIRSEAQSFNSTINGSCEQPIYPYDPRVVVHEAIAEITKLIQDTF